MASLDSLMTAMRTPAARLAAAGLRRSGPACAAALLAAACAYIPQQQPIVQGPMTAVPPPRPLVAQSTGAIYTGYSDHRCSRTAGRATSATS